VEQTRRYIGAVHLGGAIRVSAFESRGGIGQTGAIVPFQSTANTRNQMFQTGSKSPGLK